MSTGTWLLYRVDINWYLNIQKVYNLSYNENMQRCFFGKNSIVTFKVDVEWNQSSENHVLGQSFDNKVWRIMKHLR